MTHDEVGVLFLKVQKKLVGRLCALGCEPDRAEDCLMAAFEYILKDKDASGFPIQPRYRRRSPQEVERLLWIRMKGEMYDAHDKDMRDLVAEPVYETDLSPTVFKPIESSNDVEEKLRSSA
jgi:hypothetical protein